MFLRNVAFMTVAALIGQFAVPGNALAKETSRTIFGWVERVVLSSEGFSVKAKLDTGARTSSLDARNIEMFEHDGEKMVRFDVLDPDSEKYVTLERHLVRIVRIRQHEDGEEDLRPVVRMTLCVGHHAQRVEVNLVDRSEFIYPLLVGRTAMRGAIIVDPALTFTSRPLCSREEMSE